MNTSSEWAPRTARGDGAGVLDISDVTVRFGGLTALDSVSFAAAPCQVTGVIGPNGAGKTTLLNVLCGFVRPDAGKLTFGGNELTGLRPHQLASLGIARTLQNVGLFPRLTVAENVMAGANCHARAGQLPFAHRKRAALARDLVAQPRLLLLDEPASGLTETELPELGRLITNLAVDASVVVIEHRMDLMMSVCDTIAVLDFGKLIAFGTPAQVQADPAVTDAYLGAARATADPPQDGQSQEGQPQDETPSDGPPQGEPPAGEQAHE